MMKKSVKPVVILTLLILFASSAVGEAVKKIQDNSFLVEEAYNQEDGVIQHIQSFQYFNRSNQWMYTFVQEWPVPTQKHQFSYTVPVFRINDGGGDTTGLGDIALNYRYQLILKDSVALAPRFSLIIPTGNYKKGLGNGALGYQFNIPLSVELSDKWVTHWNAGATFTPQAKEASGGRGDTFGYNLGANIIYLLSDNLNLLTEVVWSTYQRVQSDSSSNWEEGFFINPGIRYAFNFKSGLQIVPGLSFPIGLGQSNREYGVFLYLSFEHPLF